jgi:hypothetical protein
MLSTTNHNGKRIAEIINTKSKKPQFIYLNDIKNKKPKKQIKSMRTKYMYKNHRDDKYDSDNSQDELLYSDEEEEEEESGRIIKIRDGTLIQAIDKKDKNQRLVAYFAGASGAGKSTGAAQLAISYKEAFPKNPIYLFSRIEDDKVYKGLGIIQIPITEVLLEQEIDLVNSDAVKNGAMIIFDDIDTIISPELKKAVYKVLLDALEIGRHLKLYITVMSHLINGNDHNLTRTILNESGTITIFPHGNIHAVEYLLNKYFGIPNRRIKQIITTDSRYITFGRTYPYYMIKEKSVELL